MKAKCLLIGVFVLFTAGMLTTQSYAKIDPETVVGMWLLDDNKGDIATDSSGKANDGTLFKVSLPERLVRYLCRDLRPAGSHAGRLHH